MRDMEGRNFVHQPIHRKGGVVTAGQVVRIPLLPYERQLIDLLGISREEYEQFSLEVARRSKERPAEYAHIPDIQNAAPLLAAGYLAATGAAAGKSTAVTAAVVSLAIGAATTAVAYLLTPKPKPLTASAIGGFGGSSIELAGLTGADRFTPTSGFDSQQSLANYGSAIPLIFTDGGLLISPLLVWSRVISRGKYQIAELQFLVGQGPLPIRTDWSTGSGKYGNLFLGTNTIDPSSSQDFAFYYRDGSGNDNRFGREHLKAGQLNATVPLAFTAPTNAGDDGFAFSSTFTPTNQSQFGVYNGIPNATNLRLNWQVLSQNTKIPLPERDYTPLDMRNWISGPQADHDAMINAGMSGTGTNFARRIGIVDAKYATVERLISSTGGTKATIYKGVEGDEGIGTEVRILIGAGTQSDKFGSINWNKRDPYPVNQGKDIQNILDGEHASHDDAMQMGEQFMIGTGLWMVVKRELIGGTSDVVWQKGRTIRVTLRCIKRVSGYDETGKIESVKFGVAREEAIKIEMPPYAGTTDDNGNATFVGLKADGTIDEKLVPFARETFATKDLIIDEAFFPICKASFATVQNTRPCDVTEIGLKSQVWLRFNNLCNFSTIPSSDVLKRADADGTQYQTGYMNKYAKRVSFFSLDIRDAGSAADAEWSPCGRTFAIQGDTPTDLFNYIRVYHGTTRALEFRLRPRTSADAIYLNSPEWKIILLDASKDVTYPWSHTVDGRSMEFITNGREVTSKELWGLQEMGAPYLTIERIPTTTPKSVSWSGAYRFRSVGGTPTAEDISKAWQFMIAYRTPRPNGFGADVMSPSPLVMDITTGEGKTFYEFYDPTKFPVTTEAEVQEAYKPSDSNYVRFKFKLTVVNRDGVNRWELLYATIEAAGTGWKIDDLIPKGLIQGYYAEAKTLEAIFKVATVVETEVKPPVSSTRVFGKYTAIAEVSQYANEIQRSCDNNPEHQIVYVNESIKDSPEAKYPRCAMAGLRLRSGRSFNSLDQFRIFAQKGIEITTLPPLSASKPVTSSKLLTDVANYMITNTETGAGLLADGLVDEDQMRNCAKFLVNNQFYYNDVITDPVNIRQFLGQIAPSMLSSVVVRNGRFSLEPALPIDSAGAIVSSTPVPITAMFTSGNIIEDTFNVEYLGAEERKDFTAVVRWRKHNENEFPQSRTIVAYYSDITNEANRPIEEFDLRWIENENHAKKAARYFLSIRRNVTHTVRFKTTPLASVLNPGSFIIVSTDSNPYTPVNNGIILSDGTIMSASDLTAGTFDIYYWQRGEDGVREGSMVVTAGSAAGTFKTAAPRNVIFAIRSSGVRNNCYLVESISLDEDGMVDVTATHFPLDSLGKSVIAQEVTSTGGVSIVEEAF